MTDCNLCGKQTDTKECSVCKYRYCDECWTHHKIEEMKERHPKLARYYNEFKKMANDRNKTQ